MTRDSSDARQIMKTSFKFAITYRGPDGEGANDVEKGEEREISDEMVQEAVRLSKELLELIENGAEPDNERVIELMDRLQELVKE